MKPGVYCAILSAVWLIVMPATGVAQSSDVTFQVPVNVTRLSSDITKVEVFCEITSSALPALAGQGSAGKARSQVDLTPSAGQVVQTVAVVVPIPSLDTSGGKTSATYQCTFTGFSQSRQQWARFDAAATVAAFRLSPTPADLTGSFTW